MMPSLSIAHTHTLLSPLHHHPQGFSTVLSRLAEKEELYHEISEGNDMNSTGK